IPEISMLTRPRFVLLCFWPDHIQAHPSTIGHTRCFLRDHTHIVDGVWVEEAANPLDQVNQQSYHEQQDKQKNNNLKDLGSCQVRILPLDHPSHSLPCPVWYPLLDEWIKSGDTSDCNDDRCSKTISRFACYHIPLVGSSF